MKIVELKETALQFPLEMEVTLERGEYLEVFYPTWVTGEKATWHLNPARAFRIRRESQ